MDTAKNIVNLFSEKVTRGQILPIEVVRRIGKMPHKHTLVILNGSAGMGKSEISSNKSATTAYLHKTIDADMSREPMTSLRTLLWYDHLSFIKYIRFIDELNTPSIIMHSAIDNYIILKYNIFDNFVFRVIASLDGYRSNSLDFKSKVDKMFEEMQMLTVIKWCRCNIIDSMKVLKAAIEYKIVWAISLQPIYNVYRLKNRVFYSPDHINWVQFCKNQTYLFEKLAILMGFKDIVYISHQITLNDIVQHLEKNK